LPARLHLVSSDGGQVVHDTRSGHEVVHPLDEHAQAVLAALTTPKSIAALAESELGQRAGFDADAQVRRLLDRNLLFAEGDRFLSLVLPRAPTPMSWDRDDLWSHGNLPAYLFPR
jgi:hypothetical protein